MSIFHRVEKPDFNNPVLPDDPEPCSSHWQMWLARLFEWIDEVQQKGVGQPGADGAAGADGVRGKDGVSGKDSIPMLLKNVVRQGRMAATAIPVFHTPSSTNTGTGVVTFGSAHGWISGTRCTAASTGGGLVTGTTYYLNIPSTTTATFHLTVADALAGTNKVTLSANITQQINPDAIAFANMPITAFAAAIAAVRNEGTTGSWIISFSGIAPSTSSYSVKIGPGDSTLATLGESFTEENPPVGDMLCFHDNPGAGGAGALAFYVAYNDGNNPANGPSPNVWRQAAGAPSNGLGINGDFYLDTTASDIYQKIAGTYQVILNIHGSVWRSGSGAPSNGLGTNGDFYLDTVTANVYQKAAGAYTLLLSILGPAGPAGSGGSPSGTDFRLSLVTGVPVFAPQTATPSSTDTTAETTTFATDPGWPTGTMVIATTTVGGLTIGTVYFVNRNSSTVYSYHTTFANAVAGTSKVNLTANVTSAILPIGIQGQTLYMTPFIGGQIQLYNGSAWASYTTAEISLALGTLTSGKNYDVFCFVNSSTPTLELSAAWTDDVTRADALSTQDSVIVNSADHKRKYIGTIRMVSTTECEDSARKRFVWNWQNRLRVPVNIVSNDGSSYAYSTNTWRQVNASVANQIEVVTGQVGSEVDLKGMMTLRAGANNGGGAVGIALDVTSLPHGDCYWTEKATPIDTWDSVAAILHCYVPVGRHFLAFLQRATSNGTTTWGGWDVNPTIEFRTGMGGTWQA